MENILEIFQSEQYPWLWQVFVIVFLTLVANFFAKRFLAGLEKQFSKTDNLWDDAFLAAVQRPATVMIWLIGLNATLEVISATTEVALFEMAGELESVLVIAVLTWVVLNTAKQIELRLLDREPGEENMDHSTVMAMGKLLRTAITITAVLVVLQTLGYSISGVLAFGGIGGLAVGFAAKDLLANFFGGLMIYMDRPFSVGDWVRSPDQNIEGTVEHIGWRLTRIRTFDKRPLYVPNSTFTHISVENPSRMSHRRIYETVGLRYDDAEQVSAIIEDVKAMLREHEEIATDQTLIVNFNAFGASSLDFFIYTFTKTTNWIRFHEVKQDVLLKVLAIVHQHGADVAFPTQTLKIEERLALSGEETPAGLPESPLSPQPSA